MTPEDESNVRVSAKTGIHPQQVAQILAQFGDTAEFAVVRAKFEDRIQMFMDERIKRLRNIAPEELKYVQGVADGLALAITQIQEKL